MTISSLSRIGLLNFLESLPPRGEHLQRGVEESAPSHRSIFVGSRPDIKRNHLRIP